MAQRTFGNVWQRQVLSAAIGSTSQSFPWLREKSTLTMLSTLQRAGKHLLLVGYGVCSSRELGLNRNRESGWGWGSPGSYFLDWKFQLEKTKADRGSLVTRGVGQQEDVRQEQFTSSFLTRLLTWGSLCCRNMFFLPSLPTPLVPLSSLSLLPSFLTSYL